MDETNQNPETASPQQDHEGRLAQFGRRHPLLTIAGVAAAGLAGGIEMAAGVLLGAAALAVVRRRNIQPTTEAPAREEPRSPELQRFRERARAVMMAARGDLVAPPSVH